MKTRSLTIMVIAITITASAQHYNARTSSKTTDYFGNRNTTHQNQYGQTTGTSTSSTDNFVVITTTQRDCYGTW